MIWKNIKIPFKINSKNSLGIDIGTSSIRVVEMSQKRGERRLENYSEIKTEFLGQKTLKTFDKNILNIPCEDVSRGIRAILEEAKISTRNASFSIPDFSSFFTTFKVPVTDEAELPEAVKIQSQQYIPLPLSEITLDWQLIKKNISDKKISSVEVLLVAVPNQIIHQYQEIARLAFLDLKNLEAEVFGLLRAVVKQDDPVILLDIGEQTSNISIVYKKQLRASHSFDVSGDSLTNALSSGLNVNTKIASDLKKKYGLLPLKKDIRKILIPFIDSIGEEVEKMSNHFEDATEQTIKKIILAGGGALLPGLKEYLSGRFWIAIEIADPFFGIAYNSVLDERLKDIGPSYAIAAGEAMGGL